MHVKREVNFVLYLALVSELKQGYLILLLFAARPAHISVIVLRAEALVMKHKSADKIWDPFEFSEVLVWLANNN